LKHLKKGNNKIVTTKSEADEASDPNLATGDVSGDETTVRDKDQAFASKYS
jgi:hypothetical protein